MTSTLLMGDLYYEHLLLVLFIRLQISLLSHSFTLSLCLSVSRTGFLSQLFKHIGR